MACSDIIEFGVTSPAQFSLSVMATNVYLYPLFASAATDPHGTTYARLETLDGTLVTNVPLATVGNTRASRSLLLVDGGRYRFIYHSEVTSPDSGGIKSGVSLQMKVGPAPPDPIISMMRGPGGSPQVKVSGANLGQYRIEYSHRLGANSLWQRFQRFNAAAAPYEFRFPINSLDTSATVFFRLREDNRFTRRAKGLSGHTAEALVG